MLHNKSVPIRTLFVIILHILAIWNVTVVVKKELILLLQNHSLQALERKRD